ncbi:3,4-dehydroadipyl-CoA semialdehyde dehydrogenase [Derxia gummosa]|uniref:3,4-dehydroadipyl-CoA semialdehyde dehydrogenase n=1 Tax=Derxia gummosa DSM 723 TaxID=1121388 RepID=A0A8B6X821_9BURK|nr:3,4-dehydroadipyl-CoA semialdehyde dehydrogenase [Derxia gummosa]
MTTELLPNFLGGEWVAGQGESQTLTDPVTGEALVRVSSAGLDLKAGFAFARERGGAALRAMSYGQRAAMLGAVLKVLQANRDSYEAISTANSGTTKADTAVDVDGAMFTLGWFAKAGAALGEARALLDGPAARLAKDDVFRSQHLLLPARGLALFINAFNFPAWGLWEKAAPALLSGVPVVVKPATATAWLTQKMVADVVAAGVLPAGALSIVCGGSGGLLDALAGEDVVSFTGSAATAATIRGHAAFREHSVRLNVEADSLNSALLLPDAAPGSDAFNLFVREVVREMTVKSGQKCTAIRRVFVPAERYDAVAEAIGAKLAGIRVGNPRDESVRMGSLVSRDQYRTVRDGIAALRGVAEVLHDGDSHALVGADPAVAACVGPTLLGARDAAAATLVHDLEVFGPVATLLPYASLDEAHALVRRGQGSLVASLYGADHAALAASCLALGDLHGRLHVVSPDCGAAHTGHGNVMPQSLHGGPGRAGGGEELGGLRGLGFYHRRCAVQAAPAVLEALAPAVIQP